MDARSREAQNAQSQAQSAQTPLASAQQQLADLQPKKTDCGVVVTLGDVLFDTGQATLKPGAVLRDETEAEAALQEAYLLAYRLLGQFRGDHSARSCGILMPKTRLSSLRPAH